MCYITNVFPNIMCYITNVLPNIMCYITNVLPNIMCYITNVLPNIMCYITNVLPNIMCYITNVLPNIMCYITNVIPNIICVKFGKLIWTYKLIIWHLLASVHQPTQSWQVQFIDVWHQKGKLHEIYFWMKMIHFCMDLIAISVTP